MEKTGIKCLYCFFYQESPTQLGASHFCNHVQKMVNAYESCDDGFEAHKFFWCNKTEQKIDLIVCPARQSRGMSECAHCRQKAEVLEIRKYMGRKNGFLKKKIIKKMPEEEVVPQKKLIKKQLGA